MFYAILGLMTVLSLLLLFRAEKVVAMHADMYCRHYPTARERAILDRMQSVNPLSRWVIGRMSDYAEYGPEHPERFPRMVAFVRGMGAVLFAACILALLTMAA